MSPRFPNTGPPPLPRRYTQLNCAGLIDYGAGVSYELVRVYDERSRLRPDRTFWSATTAASVLGDERPSIQWLTFEQARERMPGLHYEDFTSIDFLGAWMATGRTAPPPPLGGENFVRHARSQA